MIREKTLPFKYRLLSNIQHIEYGTIGCVKLVSVSRRSSSSSNLSYTPLKGRCLLIPKYSCEVYNYVGKADLSKGYGNPKRKLGVITHFFFFFFIFFIRDN